MEDMYYLDLRDDLVWLIKDRNGNRFTAGRDKSKVESLITNLNMAHRPNLLQLSESVILICWNNHDKGDKCEYETLDLR